MPSETMYPGVYVEEVWSDVHTIPGVATSNDRNDQNGKNMKTIAILIVLLLGAVLAVRVARRRRQRMHRVRNGADPDLVTVLERLDA